MQWLYYWLKTHVRSLLDIIDVSSYILVDYFWLDQLKYWFMFCCLGNLRLIVNSDLSLLRYVSKPLIRMSFCVIAVRDEDVCRLVKLLVYLLAHWSMSMVFNPINNHPPSVGSARIIHWDIRINHRRGFLSSGMLVYLLFVVNNPSIWLNIFLINHEGNLLLFFR